MAKVPSNKNELRTGGIGHEECPTELLVNPFVHRLELETTYEMIKTAILTVILLPIRVALICFFMITGWMFASIGLMGMTEEELRSKPLEGWRKTLRFITSKVILYMFTAGGFRLKVVGKMATRATAPVVVLAPHSTFIDSLPMTYMAGPSIVAKGETAFIPLFGRR